jgi:hypothetical protein
MFTIKEILSTEVAPALGCTEPVAIALGAAAAKSLVPHNPVDQIEIWVDPNIYKNGVAVSIPGAAGATGPAWFSTPGSRRRSSASSAGPAVPTATSGRPRKPRNS